MPEHNGNGENKFLARRIYKDLLEKSKEWPSCKNKNCGAPTSAEEAFCGDCGLQNADFDHEKFELDAGMSLEDMKKKEQCDSGHGPAREATARGDIEGTAHYCIFCGKPLFH